MAAIAIKDQTSCFNAKPESSSHEERAAIAIQRCFRRHLAPLTALEAKDVQKIPHRQWEKLLTSVSQLVRQKNNPAFTKRFQSALGAAMGARSRGTIAYVPCFTSVGKRTNPMRLPIYRRLRFDARAASSWIVTTKEAAVQFRCMDKVPIQTKQELDTLVKLLFNEDLISWEITQPCCFARAELAVRFLVLMGIPESHIQKLYVMTHPSFEPREPITWGYCHVVPLIQLADGSQWILDPALNRVSAITFDEWIKLQPEIIAPPHQIPAELIKQYVPHPGCETIISTTPIRQHISLSDDRREIDVSPLELGASLVVDHIVAQSREAVECAWIERLAWN